MKSETRPFYNRIGPKKPRMIFANVTEEMFLQLRELAKSRKVTIAHLIRESVEILLPKKA